MRKIYIYLLSLLFGAPVASAVEIPYSSPIAVSDAELDEGWTVINANGDVNVNTGLPTTWRAVAEAGGNTSNMVCYTYAYSYAADDYLVSPPLSLKAGNDYKLSFKMKTQNPTETLTVYLASGNEEAKIQAGSVIFDWEDKSDQNLTIYTVPVSVAADGDYYISWYAHSPRNKGRIYICDMQLIPDVFEPSPVSSLTATPGENRELKCDLNWILPTTTILGEPFTEEQKIELIEIFRDDDETPIASFTEPVTDFSDTAASGLTSGRHTYSIIVTVDGVKSKTASTALTSYIGPLAPMSLPFSITIDEQDNFDLFSVISGENTDVAPENQWHYATSYVGKYAAHSRTAKDTKEDSWLISPPIKVDNAGNYNVTFNASLSNVRRSKKLEAYYGISPDPDEMALKAEDFDLTESAADYSFAFNAAEPGTYYIAFHVAAESDTYAQEYRIFNLNVEAVEHQTIIPAPVSDLKAKASKDQTLDIIVSWVNPTTDFAGNPITTSDYAVKIYLDDEEEPALTVEGDDLVSEGRQIVTVPVSHTGIHTVRVAAVNISDPVENPEYREVKTNWVGGKFLSCPFTLSFEEGSVEPLMCDAVDGNEDGKSFMLASDSFILAQPSKGEDGLCSYNDYLLSPSFMLDKGYYVVRYKVTGGEDAYVGGSYQPKTEFGYHIGVAKIGDVTEESQEFIKRSDLLTVACDSYARCEEREYIFEISEAGAYEIVLAADVKNPELTPSKYFTLHDLSFDKMPLLPGVVTKLSVSAGDNKTLEATISWKNPTDTNIEGVMLEEDAITKAVIYRNGEEIAEVTSGLTPGETAMYIDSTLPSPGKHLYAVELYTADGPSSEAASVVSPWIGGGLPAAAKYEADGFESWTLIDADNDYDEYFGHNAWSVHPENGLRLRNPNSQANDWAISPRHEFEAGQTYKLTIESRFDLHASENPYTLDIYLSEGEDHTAIRSRHFLRTVEISPEYTTHAAPQVTEIYFSALSADAPALLSGDDPGVEENNIPTVSTIEAGTRNIAIHANSQGEIFVKSVAIQDSEIPTGLTEVETDGISLASGSIIFNGEAEITVIAIDGTIVNKTTAENRYSLQSLSKGIYIIEVASQTEHRSIRIII